VPRFRALAICTIALVPPQGQSWSQGLDFADRLMLGKFPLVLQGSFSVLLSQS